MKLNKQGKQIEAKDFKISRMQKRHVREVLQIAVESNLSYWSYEDYILETSRADSYCLVVEEFQQVIGFVVARLIKLENYAEILNIAVKEEYRNYGIAHKLLKEIDNICITYNLHKIILEVRETNKAAFNLYTKCGYKILRINKNFYKSPDENGLTMSKEL